MSSLRRLLKRYWEIFIIFLASLTPLLWLPRGEVILGHDSVYRLMHAAHIWSDLFSWNNQVNFGISWPYARGYLPINLLEELFRMIAGTFSGMQTLEFIFWFFVLGMSLYTLVKTVFPEQKYWFFRIFCSIFYTYNFYILQGWFIADRGRFSFAAGIPLALTLVIRVYYKITSLSKASILFGFLTAIFNANGLPPLIGSEFIIIAVAVIFFTFVRVLRSGIKELFFGIKVGFFFLISFAGMNAYWLYPLFRFTFGRYGTSMAAIGGIEGLINWEQTISRNASILNLLRLQGIPDWYENASHAFSGPFLHNPLLIVLSFVPLVLVVFGVFWKRQSDISSRQRDLLIFLFVLLVFGIFFVGGSHPPFGFAYIFLLRHIPGFAIFRTSFYKFAPMVWLPMIVLSGYYLTVIVQSIVTNSRWFARVACLMLAGLIAYHYPYFNPTAVFHLSDYFSTRVTVPPYVLSTSAYIEKNVPKTGRILMFPKLESGFIGSPLDTYVWGYYSLESLPALTTTKTFINNGSNDDYLVALLYKSLYQNNTGIFMKLAGRSGITHILWRGDVRLTDATLKTYPMADMEQRLQQMKGIRLVFSSGSWKLYELEPVSYVPMVAAAEKAVIVQTPSIHDAYLFAGEDISPATILLRSADTPSADIRKLASARVVEAECYMCHTDEYRLQVKGLTLPSAKVLPGDALYGTVQQKENNVFTHIGEVPSERIDADLAFSLVRISEMQKMITEHRNEKYITATGMAYVELLSDIQRNISALKDRQKDVYAVRILSYLDAELQWLSPMQAAVPYAWTFLTQTRGDVSKMTWMTEDQQYPRFGVTLQEDGVYRLYAPEDRNMQVSIDGIRQSQTESVPLRAGYHRIELTRSGSQKETLYNYPILFFYKQSETEQTGGEPTISFQVKNPTLYTVHMTASSPYFLRLGQRFDRGWIVKIEDHGALPVPIIEDNHFEADGFANVWHISKTGEYNLVISYTPQQDFVTAVVISVLSIVTAVSIFSLMTIRKRKR